MDTPAKLTPKHALISMNVPMAMAFAIMGHLNASILLAPFIVSEKSLKLKYPLVARSMIIPKTKCKLPFVKDPTAAQLRN